ncbi:hypothetical protein [Flavobacterium seoulense]|uniref:hypothetical protein n=1 Tax=Flavobacterium seoulense TaxID=1492738 RepID=UPI00054E6247|nr:hypothetical protein [Flavobacterium seoulense]
MIQKLIYILFLASAICTSTVSNAQEPTKLTIRALAKDAKFIGTGIGGAYIIVKNHDTQEVLAKGYTAGTSGNTDLIVTKPKVRYERITDDKTAKFVAALNISEPLLVDIEAIAPFNRKSAAIKATTQVWVIPNKDILGDGIILEIPGFIVDILSPTAHEVISFDSNQKKEVTLKVNMVMMCGCVIQNDGIWNASNYDVDAIVRKEGVQIAKVKLLKTTEDNVFEVKIPMKESGNYELIVTAFDNKVYNTGVNKINFVVK